MITHNFSRLICLFIRTTKIITVITFSSLAYGTMPSEEINLNSYIIKASLVFQGVVENIQYKLSIPTGSNGAKIPYTFVTFRIISVMKGIHKEPMVTLRFLGGLDQRDNSFYTTDQTPLFDIGDEDILFVKPKNNHLSPLINNKYGRFRIINERVFTDEGQEIFLSEKGDIRLGKRHVFEEVLKTHVGENVITFGSSKKATENNQIDLHRFETNSKAIHVSTFTEAIREFMVKAPRDITTSTVPFVSDDPILPIEGPDATPVAPPSR